MVIYLSSYEKRSLSYFLMIYIGSSTLFMLVIAYLFFENSKNSIIQNHLYSMQLDASKIAKEVVDMHMKSYLNHIHHSADNNKELTQGETNIKGIEFNSNFEVALLNKNRENIYSEFDYRYELIKGFSKHNDELYLIDDSTFGHLGVDFIVLKSTSLKEKVDSLFFDVVLLFCLFLFAILIVAIILSRLFLKPLKEEIERLDNFVQDSTHELNTPITALLLSVDSIKGGNCTEKKINRIYAAAKRISSIYNDLTYLFMSDVSTKKRERIDLSNLIKERVEFLKDIFSSKNIEICLHLERVFIDIEVDAFSRVIDNLLINAYKYNKQDGKIDIFLDKRGLVVVNDGDLIDEERISVIMERYKRADKSRGGFGIGLDIINQVCKDHKFQLSISSNKEVKNRFTIIF